METPSVVVEIEDDAPTVEQVVAYERFWKLVVERLLRERQAKDVETESGIVDKIAA